MRETAEQEVETVAEQEVILFDKNKIVVYDEFRSELEELKAKSNSLVFDWTDPKQNKEGRSHIAKLRKSKTKVDGLRKDAGRDALDFKNEVNKQGNELITEVTGIIEVHSKPLEEYEEKQQLRKDSHERNMQVFTNYKSTFESGAEVDSVEIKALIKILMDLEIGETWEEYQEPARMAREAAFKDLKPRLEYRLHIEENNEKLAQLEKENEEREEREEEQRKADKKKLDDENEAREAAATKEREEQEEKDAANDKRIVVIHVKISDFEESLAWDIEYELSYLEDELSCLNALEITEEVFEEFTDKAKLRKIDAIANLEKLIQLKKDRIEEQERLQKLEDEETERQQNEQKEADAQAERDELAADESHRKEVNASIKEALLVVPDVNAGVADDIIDLLASGTVPNVTLTY